MSELVICRGFDLLTYQKHYNENEDKLWRGFEWIMKAAKNGDLDKEERERLRLIISSLEEQEKHGKGKGNQNKLIHEMNDYLKDELKKKEKEDHEKPED